MEDSDGFLGISKKMQKTRILPLRWIGNACSYVATNSLVKAFGLQEEDNLGYRFKFHSKIWRYINKPYQWWGTYYMINTDAWKENLDEIKKNVAGQNWDDYDADGVAYWEKDE